MKIYIETGDYEIFQDLIDINNPATKINVPIEILDDVTIEFKNMSRHKGIDPNIIYEFVVNYAETVTTNVLSGLFSAWLYDKLKNKPAKLKIDDEDININKDEILDQIKE